MINEFIWCRCELDSASLTISTHRLILANSVRQFVFACANFTLQILPYEDDLKSLENKLLSSLLACHATRKKTLLWMNGEDEQCQMSNRIKSKRERWNESYETFQLQKKSEDIIECVRMLALKNWISLSGKTLVLILAMINLGSIFYRSTLPWTSVCLVFFPCTFCWYYLVVVDERQLDLIYRQLSRCYLFFVYEIMWAKKKVKLFVVSMYSSIV